MAKVQFRGKSRYRCDGCNKLIGQKQKVAIITLWLDPEGWPEEKHIHSTMACERELLVKSGIQPRLL